MSLRTINSVVFVVLLLLLGLVNAEAKNPLSENELDQTNAGGIKLRIIGEETVVTEIADPDLFVNELFGQNEVITQIVIEIIIGMNHDVVQKNDIEQVREAEDLAALTDADKDVSLILEGGQTDLAMKAVVNNVFGHNQVETSVNITLVVPAGQVGSVGGYQNAYSASGSGTAGRLSAPDNLSASANLSGPAGLSGSDTLSAPGLSGPAPQPTFQQPTSLGGAVTLMQGLAQQNPAAAPGLQGGISIVQGFQQ